MYENSRLLKRILIYLLIIQQHLTNSINNLDRMQKDREILENLPKKNKTYQLKQRLYNKKFIKEMKKYLKICNRFIKNMQLGKMLIVQDQKKERIENIEVLFNISIIKCKNMNIQQSEKLETNEQRLLRLYKKNNKKLLKTNQEQKEKDKKQKNKKTKKSQDKKENKGKNNKSQKLDSVSQK
ncbi:unnamed protein product [Paramecium sonneborni]|uniref:Transmembrane protein n=1 Tax=Paramecium sonneborni TaxID=65129 RepID=A0A8S1PXZ1_9CILI|nr:unnamed protein product [Paramecium sonneborni]